jgi:hypothetical protein
MSQLFKIDKRAEPVDKKYTGKIQIPQYEPKTIRPQLYELCDRGKYVELLRSINVSSVSEPEKEFLRSAASRHLVFNYAKIADYYAHATPEMQRLMEQSALVIIDFDDAIANGYVRLSENIKRIMDVSGEKTK